MSPHEDRVWFDGSRKLDGICEQIAKTTADGSNALVLAHFKSTLAGVEAHIRARSIEYSSYLPLDFSSLCSRDSERKEAGVWVGLASYFQTRASSAAEESTARLRILIVEHHPMAARDKAILEAAGALSCEAQVSFHSSLTDPLLTHFGGDRLRGLMTQLGMNEQEFISHPLISTAITNAQEKIEARVQREMQTLSPEDWFKFNLPS